MGTTTVKRIGARCRSDIPPDIIEALNGGTLETTNLVELLAVDFAKLVQAVCPKVPKKAVASLSNSNGMGITKRMALAGQLLLAHYEFSAFESFSIHSSDIVRSWACFCIGLAPKLSLSQRLKLIWPLAADPHSGVREWAWIALRTHVATDVKTAIQLLTSWVSEDSDYLRRFATEITRPRGVWCTHIALLKKMPSMGLPLLDPLKSDISKYVQNSVGNWLNDVAKTDPVWVKKQCAAWRKKSPTLETDKICKRALRNIKS